MKKSMLLVALATLSLGIVSCGKNEPNTPTNEEVKSVVIDARTYDEYVYFSFDEGTIKKVKIADESIKKDTSWDLGFHRYELRTNSGLSGEGQGGAYEVGVQDLKTPVTIPAADKFVPDNQKQDQIIKFDHMGGGVGPTMENLALNPILSTIRRVVTDPEQKDPNTGKPLTKTEILHEGAIVQNLDNHGTSKPASWLSNKVFIVRTAKGKYAKVKIVSHQEPIEIQGKGKTPTYAVIRMEYVYPLN